MASNDPLVCRTIDLDINRAIYGAGVSASTKAKCEWKCAMGQESETLRFRKRGIFGLKEILDR
jgi:hypothetical protein